MSELTNIDGQIALDGTEVLEEKAELTVEEIVLSLVTEETYNPYGVHKIVNAVFEIFGLDKKIPPQYVYNYSRNSMIVKGRGEIINGKRVNKDHSYTGTEVAAFVIKFTTKQINK